MRKLQICMLLLAAAGFALSGCSSKKSSQDPFAGIGSPYYNGKGPVPKGTGKSHIGEPYQVAGRWFTPREQPGYDASGPASWYGEAFNRRKTSNGEWFDMNELTAAHPTLPLPSYAKVTNLRNGRVVIVRINDRGPFVGPRIIDLSKRTAEVLAFKTEGKTDVRVQYLGPAPLRDQGEHLIAMNQRLGQGASVRQLVQFAREDSLQPANQVADAGTPQPAQTVTYMPTKGTTAATSVQMGYIISVGSFSDPDNAAAASTSLAQYGARTVPLNTGSGVIYRVIIGPLTDRNDVGTAMQAVQNAGFVDAKVASTRIQQVASR